MGFAPLNRVNLDVSTDPSGRTESGILLREIVAAIRGLNASELLGNRRELRSRRNRNGRFLIEVIDRETGETLGELPPEEVLHLADELHREQHHEEA